MFSSERIKFIHEAPSSCPHPHLSSCCCFSNWCGCDGTWQGANKLNCRSSLLTFYVVYIGKICSPACSMCPNPLLCPPPLLVSSAPLLPLLLSFSSLFPEICLSDELVGRSSAFLTCNNSLWLVRNKILQTLTSPVDWALSILLLIFWKKGETLKDKLSSWSYFGLDQWACLETKWWLWLAWKRVSSAWSCTRITVKNLFSIWCCITETILA